MSALDLLSLGQVEKIKRKKCGIFGCRNQTQMGWRRKEEQGFPTTRGLLSIYSGLYFSFYIF